MLAEAVSRPIITAKNATGEIRNYQIIVGGILLTMLPLSYLGLKLGLPVEIVPICNAATACTASIARICMLNGVFPTWSSMIFIKKVLLNVLTVSAIASALPFLSYIYLDEGWINLIVTSLLCLVCSLLSIYYVGCDKQEREMILSKSLQYVAKLRSKITKR